ncbi:hypothetical protein PV08_06986 [Exophiala spinifera]|uniref:Uncharacterized protein n=1 Tax=Exophiala spinifera TaxID=91928 RepID=A0A0D2B681_9EURO|nr:uncharacterized protein PV08_06986 [Exophiala spinifera]KIW14205.1 hypothetical protein PV08_06986 [Exophiala spinifera]
MAYAAVSQAEHDGIYSQSPDLTLHTDQTLPETSSPPLSLSFDHVSRDGYHSDVPQADADGSGGAHLGKLLKSLSSSQSYEMVEDDDYDEPMRTPQGLGLNTKAPAPVEDDALAYQSEQAPIRTASISRDLPLNHPTPDLHTLQGAFVKNVEKLEESAERLSMTSSLEEELTKMKLDQRRLERQSSAPITFDNPGHSTVQRQFSSSSWSNSILRVNQTARSGGYSPSAYITSPTGSIHSGRRQQQHNLDRHSSKGSRHDQPLNEPPLEGRPLDFGVSSRPSDAAIVPDQEFVQSPGASIDSSAEDRPPTSSSNDTYRQAQAAFHDFDGVYFNSGALSHRSDSISRHISLRQPPLARDSKAFREAQPGERMIYYPAPVPVMLNLPQRLSRMDLSERERRRLQGISAIPEDLRKSAPWLADQDNTKLPGGRSSLNLPPQLRANAFFEQPSITQDLKLKNGSAVRTLDDILDAAAYAPVSAFTDHPIAGHLGKEVYGQIGSPRKSMQSTEQRKKKRRSSLSTLLKSKRSSTGLDGAALGRSKSKGSRTPLDGDENPSDDEIDRAAAQSLAPDEDEISDGEDDAEDAAPQGFFAAPTTLLAELQMRKAHQKQRNRTAADAFPNGMHSTLLELDAVTQLQQKARKTKHVTLAWEDHDEADKQNFDDDEVPLGLLFPEKDRLETFNAHRPVGLLERREMEDNEPLSHRRARLRGEPLQSMKSETKAPYIEQIPGLSEDIPPEHEDETLAQRIARLKEEKEHANEGNFAAELSQELGLNVGKSEALPSTTPDPEETLGQRRKRLKEEALRNGRQVSGESAASATRPQLRSMHSLADILQAHPVGVQDRKVSNESHGFATRNSHVQGPLLNFNGPAPPSHMRMQPGHAGTWGFGQQHGAYMNTGYGNFYQNNGVATNGGGFGGIAPSLYGAPIPMHMQQPMAGYPYGYGALPYIQDPMSGPPLDPKQRAQIDRWRQSVAP